MIIIPPAPTSGPDWASQWTAIGTIALAAVTVLAVLVTIFITRQDRRRADDQRREDREHAQDAEQLAEAWAVEVIPKVAGVGSGTQMGVDVINLGSFTITRVDARFSPDGQSLIPRARSERLSEHDSGPYGGLQASYSRSGYEGILTRGSGMRFWSDPIAEDYLAGPYPVVRWHDRRGTC